MQVILVNKLNFILFIINNYIYLNIIMQLTAINSNFNVRELRKLRRFTRIREQYTFLNISNNINNSNFNEYIIFGSRPVYTPQVRRQIRSKLKTLSKDSIIELKLLPVAISQQLNILSNYKEFLSLNKGSSFFIKVKYDSSKSVNIDDVHTQRGQILDQLTKLVISEGISLNFKPIVIAFPYSKSNGIVVYRFNKVKNIFQKVNNNANVIKTLPPIKQVSKQLILNLKRGIKLKVDKIKE